MFSPATKKSSYRSARKDPPNAISKTPIASSIHSPVTPHTATPAPRLSVLARIPPVKKTDKGDSVEPVYVGELPQAARDEQHAILLQKRAPPGETCFSGGMDKETWLAWFICGNRLFVWSYVSPADARKYVVLDLTSASFENRNGDVSKSMFEDNSWLVYIVSWDSSGKSTGRVLPKRNPTGVILCNRKTRDLVYWPDIYSEVKTSPVTSFASAEELEVIFSPDEERTTPSKLRQRSKLGSNLTRSNSFNSFIASAIPNAQHVCLALACSSNGELWQFLCSPSGIQRKRVCQDVLSKAFQGNDGGQFVGSKGYPRSLVWHFPYRSLDEVNRQFLFLTDHEIQCFSVRLSHDFSVSKLWSHEIVGTDADLGIQKDLAGQKRIWPLDLQVDDHGKVITILIAIFCKDRITSSSYTEYSLLTMQYKSGVYGTSEYSKPRHEKILEKKAPIQVIIPKARVEDEEFLFSMRLKVGGKPAGSVIILSGDGTATVSHCWRGSTRLYQFDLPYDAGKVLDASVFPSSDDGEDGAWAVLTEKAGIWAIPERAVLLGGVEPPERSLSRKGSSNERSSAEERRNLSFASNITPRRVSSETWDSGDRPRGELAGVTRRTAQDEESEALLSELFHDFLLSGQVNGVCDKLKNSGAFDKDGETNVFARTSKSIVDTLAKHWTTTRGAEIVSLSIVSSQLVEKQQKHQKYLQFLALSKCHEELSSRQRESLHIIMEHGEKLACMIQLRELQNMISQNRSTVLGSSYSPSETQISGALWDLIQLVGERARRNTVLLMDRDNAEVFYSKVSDLHEVFLNLERQLECIISRDISFAVQFQRACELSNACVTLLRTAMHYRTEHHLWYPLLEGLTPWFCQSVVRDGLWTVASFMVQLLSEPYSLDNTAKLDFHLNLEVLFEVLLEAYSGAIMAKIERGEEHKSLLDEYWNKRDSLLGALYYQVKDLAQAKLRDSSEEIEGQYEEILRKLSSRLLSIATRHEGYQTLWNICCDLNDFELLRNLMHQSMGPKGGFSYFVFKQLHSNRQFSKLMRLGEEFQEELATFLSQHQDLVWLHEVFLHRFLAASETLHKLALSDNQSSDPVNEETYSFAKIKITLAERRRFLKLSKIAALAGKNADYEAKVRRIDADLKILELQENTFKLFLDIEEKERFGEQLLPPVDLIELCLKSQNRELCLLAFDVFAWTSCSFLRRNSSLLEECWRNAANQDDWEQLYQMSIAEGWGEEETLRYLSDTVLFQASSRCYGPEAETFEGGFDEVLPLRQENSELSNMKDTVSSVESILMQHKDFPDAGKLMLTAVMLGSVQVGASTEGMII